MLWILASVCNGMRDTLWTTVTFPCPTAIRVQEATTSTSVLARGREPPEYECRRLERVVDRLERWVQGRPQRGYAVTLAHPVYVAVRLLEALGGGTRYMVHRVT